MLVKSGKTPLARDLLQADASKQEEVALVAALQRKENQAFVQLIDRWFDRLYQVAFRFLRQEENAQDVLQEVLRKVVEKIGTFKAESSLYTWLYRITVNECLMRLRSAKRKKSISWDEVLPHYENGILAVKDPVSDWSKQPDTKLIEQEARAFIHQCVEELPEDYRAPYVLKDQQQLSEKEVCEILGIKKTVMKIRVHRARMFLRKRLEEHYGNQA